MDPKIKDIRLHTLVKYIIKEYRVEKDGPTVHPRTNEHIYTVRYEFTADNLRSHLYPWYYIWYWFVQPSVYETNYFCKILNKDGILVQGNTYGQWKVQSHNLANAREAYFGKIYLEKKQWIIAIYVSTILNAFAAIALVVLTYFADQGNEIKQEQSKEIQQLHEELEKMKQQNQLLESQVPDSLKRPSLPKN